MRTDKIDLFCIHVFFRLVAIISMEAYAVKMQGPDLHSTGAIFCRNLLHLVLHIIDFLYYQYQYTGWHIKMGPLFFTAHNVRSVDQIGTKFGTNQRYFILNITFICITFGKQGGAV